MRATLLASAIASTLWCSRFFGRFDPRFEPVALPALWLDQHDPGRLYEQNAQVAIAASRYLAQDGAVSGRYLVGHQSEPGTEVTTLREHFARTDRGHHGARDERPDAGYRHQSHAGLILTGERCDLAGETFNARIEPTPVFCQVLDYPQHTG